MSHRESHSVNVPKNLGVKIRPDDLRRVRDRGPHSVPDSEWKKLGCQADDHTLALPGILDTPGP
jgi:hypothetical protein